MNFRERLDACGMRVGNMVGDLRVLAVCLWEPDPEEVLALVRDPDGVQAVFSTREGTTVWQMDEEVVWAWQHSEEDILRASPGKKVKHHKGGSYEIVGFGICDLTLRKLVVYSSCDTGIGWARDVGEFWRKFA